MRQVSVQYAGLFRQLNNSLTFLDHPVYCCWSLTQPVEICFCQICHTPLRYCCLHVACTVVAKPCHISLLFTYYYYYYYYLSRFVMYIYCKYCNTLSDATCTECWRRLVMLRFRRFSIICFQLNSFCGLIDRYKPGWLTSQTIVLNVTLIWYHAAMWIKSLVDKRGRGRDVERPLVRE